RKKYLLRMEVLAADVNELESEEDSTMDYVGLGLSKSCHAELES
ncbi:hypothetical protein Tco_0945988, partial [Tanacetum coccineum]